MIAIAESTRRTAKAKPAAPKFEELLPTIERQARVAFRAQPASEREELIAETVANAFCAYQRLVERGLGDVIYATPLANYAIKQIRSGRRVGSKLNIRDVSSPYCQQRNGVRVERLHGEDHAGCWQEVLVEDRTAGPADIAATRIDFTAWLRTLTPKQRRIAKTLAIGETTTATARKFGLSLGCISQLRGELRDAWLSFQGELGGAAFASVLLPCHHVWLRRC